MQRNFSSPTRGQVGVHFRYRLSVKSSANAGGELSQDESGPGLERAGRALKQLRLRRRLSLDAASNLTAGYRDPIHKSYLHRLEAGMVSPSVSKLAALAIAYGVPTVVLVEMFEIEERLSGVTIDPEGQSAEALLADAEARLQMGRQFEAFALAQAGEIVGTGDTAVKLKQCQIACLLQMGAFETAKSEALRLAERPNLSAVASVYALYLAATACSHLKLFTAAFALLDHAARNLQGHEIPVRTEGYIASLRGTLEHRTGQFEASARSFADAVRRFESVPDSHEACRWRINLTSAMIEMGDFEAALSHLDVTLRTAEASGFQRLVALALRNVSLAHYRRGDYRESRRAAMRSNQVAIEVGYNEVLFHNSFYLGELAKREGDETSRAMHERTLRRLLKDVDPDSPEAGPWRHAYRKPTTEALKEVAHENHDMEPPCGADILRAGDLERGVGGGRRLRQSGGIAGRRRLQVRNHRRWHAHRYHLEPNQLIPQPHRPEPERPSQR